MSSCDHPVPTADACRFVDDGGLVLVCRACCPYCEPGRERSYLEVLAQRRALDESCRTAS